MTFFHSLRHSLAARILGVFLVTGIAVLLVITLAWGAAMKQQWNTKIRAHLLQYIDYVNADIGTPPDPQRADELTRLVPVNIYIKGPGIDYSSIDVPLDLEELEFDDEHHGPPWRRKNMTTAAGVRFAVGEYDDRTIIRTRSGGFTVYYELRHRGSTGQRDHGRGAGILLSGTVIALLLVLGLCFWVIHRLLRPVREIQAGVARMGQGELAHRIETRRNDDLGQLTSSINAMASDIEQMLDAKRQMLLGISHELRTPITRAKVSVELLDESAARARLENDLLEMESLVTALIESERLNTRHSALNAEAVEIAPLLESVIAQGFAGQVNIDLAADMPALTLDATRLRLLLRNLLSNAVRYSDDTPPTLRARVTQRTLVIEVEDYGEGIAAQDIDKLTEPFYRVDPSRTRATGGFGLGLYLCRLICEAHGGSLLFSSTPGVGTTVTATLNNQTAHLNS